ncbi:MAG: TIGR04283 family arsenosugar biosynthesis glycosyltransferase [Nodosilinea sp.]
MPLSIESLWAVTKLQVQLAQWLTGHPQGRSPHRALRARVMPERATPERDSSPAARSTTDPHQAAVSIVIPALNEAGNLAQVLKSLQTTSRVEVIVVDGGSFDATSEIALRWATKVVTSRPGRSHQMNQGAALATSPVLLFLHADTRLPQGFEQIVHRTLAQPGVVAGAFKLAIDSPRPALRWVEWGVNVRSHRLQMPYGDQGIFLRAETFHALGGFPELPMMEDFELMRRLKNQGKVAIAAAAVTTSDRRWRTLGIWRTTLANQAMVVGYLLGVSPDKLARWYRNLGKLR